MSGQITGTWIVNWGVKQEGKGWMSVGRGVAQRDAAGEPETIMRLPWSDNRIPLTPPRDCDNFH